MQSLKSLRWTKLKILGNKSTKQLITPNSILPSIANPNLEMTIGAISTAATKQATAEAATGTDPKQARNATAPRKGASQGELVELALMPSPQPLVDIGINLVDDAFHKDLPDVLERAKRANVACMVVTGTCMRTVKKAQKLCASTSDVPLYFTAGVHPHNAKECNDRTLEELRQLAGDPKCVAIGECGLDFNRNFSPPDVQEEWFEKQVQLAIQVKKPLFMHCRDAGSRFAEILRKYDPLPIAGVVHCFTGSKQELELFLELGLHIGITGWVCDDRPERGGAELAALLPTIPHDRLMIETDGPYLIPRTITPSKSRPHRNEPALLPFVLKTVASSLGEEEAVVANRTTEVARKFFGLTF